MAKQEEDAGGITALAKSEGLRSKWNYQGGLSPKNERVPRSWKKRNSYCLLDLSCPARDLRPKIDGRRWIQREATIRGHSKAVAGPD
ncbi:hypothetical protein K0M31_009234 [Melipona bicolor]|uniref:Uncharacterized protein n=1 Tax=Melipona bicolor TaxID=60889 RepID=A0AA40FP96_9HYME|nr:hypothetical protein K0M31_009234 [Melipona bicolor]